MRLKLLTLMILIGCHCSPVTCQEIIPTPQIILPMVPVVVEPDTPKPADPIPKAITTLKADEWFIVESTVELIALQSPGGLVTIDYDNGPITLRGKFSDGTGKIERRKYTSPFVYSVTGVKAGTFELILIPVGVVQEKDIERLFLTVTDGTLPNPPPDPGPGPEPDPAPPQPVTSFRVIFVKESGDTLGPQQTAIPAAKAIRDYLIAKTTPEGGVAGWREYDPQQTTANEQPTIKALWEAVLPKLLPAPCMVIEVNGKATVMPFPANVDEAIATLRKYGGT